MALGGCAVSLLIGCSEQEWSESQTTQPKQVVLRAEAETKASSRSSLDEAGAFSWIKDDKIAVVQEIGDEVSVTEFAFQGETGDASGTFVGTVSEGATLTDAFAPYNILPENGTISLSTTYERNTYKSGKETPSHMPMTGKVENGAVKFTNMTAVMRLFIREIGPEGCRIVVTAPTSQLSGTFTPTTQTEDGKVYTIIASSPVNASDGMTDNQTVTYTYRDDSQTEPVNQYFFIPLPVSTDKLSYQVAVYNGESELAYFNKRTSIVPTRNKLILMPSLTFPVGDNATVAQVSDTEGLNNKLEAAAQEAEDAGNTAVDATLTVSNPDTEATTVEVSQAIEIPATITASGSSSEVSEEQSSVKITFDQVPVASGSSTSNTIVITDNQEVASDPETSTASQSNVVIAIPEAPANVVPPSFEISLPTTTVTLNATAETATFNEVTATTADNTLIVNKGVTINNLYVVNGNVRVKGIVKNLRSYSSRTIYVWLEDEGEVRSYTGDVVLLRPGDVADIVDFANESVADGQSIPFQIASFDQLKSLSRRIELGLTEKKNNRPYLTCNYVLTADLDAGDVSEWIPIGNTYPFQGKFDGGGHTITGTFTMSSQINRGGLFGSLQHATVQNITIAGSIEPAYLNQDGYVLPHLGALCGWATGTQFTNCHSKATITAHIGGSSCSSEWRVGGLVGMAETCNFLACSHQGSISETRYWSAGGICGRAEYGCTLVACYHAGVLEATDNVCMGLLCGEIDSASSLTGCWVRTDNVPTKPSKYDDFAYIYNDGVYTLQSCFAVYNPYPWASIITEMNQALLSYGWQYTEEGSLKRLEGNGIPSNPVNPW